MEAEKGEKRRTGNDVIGHDTGLMTNQQRRADFLRLPEIVWLRVMKYLPLSDRYHMTLACALFHQMFFLPALWRSVELVCFLDNDSKHGIALTLKPSHKLIAMHFGHLFHFVSLHLSHSAYAMEDETARILYSLSDRGQLKGLRLITESYTRAASNISDTDKSSINNIHRLVAELLTKAKFLRHIDVSRWPVNFSPQQRDDSLNIQDILSPDTCLHLKSLNIAMNSKTIPADFTSTEERQLVVRPVSKLTSLCHLHICQSMLSDQLLHELASTCRGQLHTLTILNRDCIADVDDVNGYNSDILSQIPEDLWFRLRASCPELQVQVVAEIAHVPNITWVLRSCVPLTSLKLLFCSLPVHFLSSLLCCKATLQSLSCYVLPGEGYDQPLLHLATACTKLQHLVFNGKINHTTILQLASLDRQWRTFRFKLKHIVVEDTDGRDAGRCSTQCVKPNSKSDRQQRLDRLCRDVSTCLGYSWAPSEP